MTTHEANISVTADSRQGLIMVHVDGVASMVKVKLSGLRVSEISDDRRYVTIELEVIDD